MGEPIHASRTSLRLEGIQGAFLGLTWIFTLLRLYVRGFMATRSWGWDDILLVTALLTFSTFVAYCFRGISIGGIGKSLADVEDDPNSLSEISSGLFYWWLFELFYSATTALLRCSIAIFLFRICQRKVQRTVIYCTMLVVLAFSTFYILLLIFQCHPVNFYWTRFNPGETGSCLPPNVFPDASYAHSAVSATADWILGTLPIWLIWDLKMNLQTKASLVVLLSFGMIAGIAAIIRIPYIHALANTDQFFTGVVDVAIWSTVETGLGIIATAACMLRPLFKKFYGVSGATSRNNYIMRRTASAYDRTRASSRGLDAERGAVNIGAGKSIITSSAGSQLGGQRYFNRKKVSVLETSLTMNESEEELTAKRNEIHVRKTVEVESHARSGEDGSMTSAGG